MKRNKVLVFVIIIIVVINLVLAVLMLYKKPAEEKVNESKKLEVDSKLVQDLRNKVYFIDDFYLNKKTTLDDLTDQDKLKYTSLYLYKLDLVKNNVTDYISSCDDLNSYVNNLDNESIELNKLCEKSKWLTNKDKVSFININKELIEQNYLFGPSTDINFQSFNILYEIGKYCIYSKTKDDYICYSDKEYNRVAYPIIFETINEATEYSDRIEIIDKSLYCLYDTKISTMQCYKNYKQYELQSKDYKEIKITDTNKDYILNKYTFEDFTSKEVIKFNQKYKHVFKKNDNGNYYWYSSEMIEA